MANELPNAAEKIVNDYMERLSARLKGMPQGDRSELLNEIRSHIHDAYMDQSGDDEIERILAVLRRLGDPADVISSWMPEAVNRMGKGKKAPLYILAGVLIALLGVPLGLGAVAVLVGLMAALFGLLIAYYGVGISLVVGGTLSSVVCFITIFAPHVIERINDAFGIEVVHFGVFQHDPELGGMVGLILALILLAVGLLILWSGKYVWRGFRLVANLIIQNVRKVYRNVVHSSSTLVTS